MDAQSHCDLLSQSVLVAVAECQGWVAYHKGNVFLRVWRLEVKVKVVADAVSGKVLHHRHGPHVVERVREISGVSFIRALISFIRAPPS